MRLPVRVTPKGGRDAVDGWALDPAGRPYLKVRVSAVAADGQAAIRKLITCAMARPLKRSRTKAVDTVRGAEAAIPITMRATSRTDNDVAK